MAEQMAVSRSITRPPNHRITPFHLPLGRFGTYPLVLVVLSVSALYLLFAPRPSVRLDETWTRIQQERFIRIGIDPSFPPFETDDGQEHLSGFDIRLAHALAEKFSTDSNQLIRIDYVYTGFDGLYDGLIAKQYDCILSALPHNPQKTEDVSFSHSYFDGGPVIVVPASSLTIKPLSLYDLFGKRVAVELGSTGDALVRRWTRRLRLDVQTSHTTREALNAVQSSYADAALVDSLSLWEFQRARSDNSLVIASAPLEHEYIVIAVRKDSSTLLRHINEAIDEWKRVGKLEEMMRNALEGK